MDLRDIDILTLLPQRPPFVMIDHLIAHNDGESTAELTVRQDNLFCREGRLLETGIVETIAQTCAARIGYMNLYQKQESVKIGLIGAIKDFRTDSELPKVGERIECHIRVVSEVFTITLVEAEVTCQGRLVARCEMKISLTDKSIESWN